MKNVAFPPLNGNKTLLAVHSLNKLIHYHIKYTTKKLKSKMYRFFRYRNAARLFIAYGLRRVVLPLVPAAGVRSPNRFSAAIRRLG